MRRQDIEKLVRGLVAYYIVSGGQDNLRWNLDVCKGVLLLACIIFVEHGQEALPEGFFFLVLCLGLLHFLGLFDHLVHLLARVHPSD